MHNDPSDPLIGQLLADRYRILRVLGEGGMGRVYLAEHVRMGRRSAVKVMSPTLAPTPDAISRFNREAANASSINHPNVAAIYDFGETADGTLYLAMEFIDGETLAAMIRRVGPLPLAVAGDLIRQIADALNAAHQLGIIHRDLKPDNILITRDSNGKDQVKVVDFGIAKTARGGGQTVTTIGMSIGTPEFMSPEQLAGEPLDSRSDIYSLGLVAFTMLTGQAPYPALASKQSLVQRLTERPRTLAEVKPGTAWPAHVQAALDRAMSPEPVDRYARATEFAHDVAAGAAAPAAHVAMSAHENARVAAANAPTVRVAAPATRAGSRNGWFVAAGVLMVVSVGALVYARKPTRAPDALPPVVRVDTTVVTSAPSVLHIAKPKRAIAQSPLKTATPQPAPVDTVTKALTRSVDSTPAVLPSPPETNAGRRAGRHAWLNASGDSVVNLQGDSTPIAIEARELFGHISRARRLASTQQVNKAGPELRTAFEEFFVFQSEHPGMPQTATLRQQLLKVSREALVACGNGLDTSSVRARRASMCDGLEKASAAISQPGRAGGRMFPNGRRGAVVPVSPDT